MLPRPQNAGKVAKRGHPSLIKILKQLKGNNEATSPETARHLIELGRKDAERGLRDAGPIE